ncbi:MAG TPA: hypothetical protein VIQ02_06335, partial [Jiangellaceae bacterium]
MLEPSQSFIQVGQLVDEPGEYVQRLPLAALRSLDCLHHLGKRLGVDAVACFETGHRTPRHTRARNDVLLREAGR